MKRYPLLAVVAMQLTACVSIPADGIVRAVGEVVTDASCVVSLSSPEDPSRALDAKPVQGEFAVNFMVPPTLKAYVVSLSCNGDLLSTKHVVRPQKQAADFGRIAL